MSKKIIEIISLNENDAEKLSELEASFFSSFWTADQFARGLKKKALYAFGIKDLEEIVAYIAFSYIDGTVEIFNIATKSMHRNIGMGKNLLLCVQNFVKENKGQKILLDVRETNYTAQRLYERVGFVQIGKRKKYYSDTGEDALIYDWNVIS